MHRGEFELFLKEIDHYVYDITNSTKENSNLDLYELAVTSLELLVMESIPKKFTTYLTGLHEIGIALEDDTVDVHIIFDDNYYEKCDRERDVGMIGFLARVLEHSGHWKVLKITGYEPNMFAVCKLSNQKFNISIGNGIKIEQYRILRHLFAIQPEAASFFHFIRHWIMEKSMCAIDVKHLLMLVVYFLQDNNFMPALCNVFMDLPQICIGDFPVQHDETRNLHSYYLNKMDYYRKHVLNFFDFYRFFDFPYNIINLYRGYVLSLKKYWRDLQNSSAINVLFMEHDYNFTPNVKFYQIHDFTNICKVSYKLFENF